MLRSVMLASATAAILAGQAFAQDTPAETTNDDLKPFTVGDKAPKIDIEHWVTGDKVEAFEDGKVYIVEFWATWCGPCRKGMPHLSELQTQFKDYGVTIIGVSDEPLETVTKFLDQKHPDGQLWKEKIQYSLTTDPDMSVYNDYFDAAWQTGIPCAFIVGKDQHIEWIGNPIWPEGAIDEALDAIVKDSWDREAYFKEWEKSQAAQRKTMRPQREIKAAVKAKDWDKVEKLLDAAIAKNPSDVRAKVNKFNTLLMAANRPEKAYAYGEELAKAIWDNPQLLNAVAWTIVDNPRVQTRNVDFAQKLALRANELTEEKDAAILDTVARTYYDKGDLKTAVAFQAKAVKVAEPGQMADEIAQTLKKYEQELAAKSD